MLLVVLGARCPGGPWGAPGSRLLCSLSRALSPRAPGAAGLALSPRAPGAAGLALSPRAPGAAGLALSPRAPGAAGQALSPRAPGAAGLALSPRAPGAAGLALSPRAPGAAGRALSPRAPGAAGLALSPRAPGASGRALHSAGGPRPPPPPSPRRLFTPPSGNELARCAGVASMMRLPVREGSAGLDACFVGTPLDTGTSNRPGARFGPRQIRSESVMVRPYNNYTHAAPFESLAIADIGDIYINLYNQQENVRLIRDAYCTIISGGCRPLTLGGDHTITYPILQAFAKQYGPVGLIHVDAHADTNDLMLGEKVAHGTPFRRCVEEGLLDCKRVVQIGLRGSGYSPDDYNWGRQQGFRVVQAEQCWFKSLAPLMKEVTQQMGSGPVYLSYDIDSLDPAYAPGTGTPETAGLTPSQESGMLTVSPQGLEIIRGCRGLNLVGCDLVEVSPPYDTTGNTALLAANLLFEMLCVLPGVKYHCEQSGDGGSVRHK